MQTFFKFVITGVFALAAYGQTTPSSSPTFQALIAPWANQQFLDTGGQPLVGGLVYTCAAGTTCPGNPLPTYTSSSGFTANSNPIVLNAGGFGSIWLSPGVAYKFVVTTAQGVVIPGAGGDNLVAAALSGTAGGGGGGGGGGGTGAAGSTTYVQYNTAGNFDASGNFTFSAPNQVLTVTGKADTPTIISNNGFMFSSGGFFSGVTGGSWQGFNSNTDGASIRGLNVGQNIANTAGGYINLGPITYNPYNSPTACIDGDGNPVQQPLPLNGLPNFGANTAVLWVAQSPLMPTNGSCGAPIPVNEDWGLMTNVYILARGGLATDNGAFSAIQTVYVGGGVPAGGVTAGSLTTGTLYPTGTTTTTGPLSVPTYLGGYINTGNSNGPPAAGTIATVTNPLTGLGGLNAGTIYYDTNLNCENLYDGSAWACMGSGGSGTPGGATTQVQFNNGGVFGGSANFEWLTSVGNTFLNVTATSSTAPGINVTTGFISSDIGFVASAATATNFNAIQAPGGGVYGLSLEALNYTQLGSHSGAPPLTGVDAFHAGAIYWDTGTSGLKVYNGSAFVSLGSGSGSPGGSTTDVQFNSSGSFAGVPAFQWLTSGPNSFLNVTATSSSAPGINVTTGFISSDIGFVANPSTATTYAAIQAPGGGVSGKSFTAVNYIQAGTFSSGGVGNPPPLTGLDTFHPGALSWDTFSSALKVFNGSTWNSIGGGGGGSPASPTNSLQFNNAGAFGGSANLTWNGVDLVAIGTSGTQTIYAQGGYIQSDTGFLATTTTATQYNSIQAPGGGVFAKSLGALNYIQSGNSTGTPTLTGFDSFRAGAMYFNNGLGAEQVYNGSTWLTLSVGGIASLNSLTGALNITNGGTSNEITVSASGTTIALTLPQAIGTSSGVNFGNVTSSGTFNSTVTGTSVAFLTSGFQMNGNGNWSSNGPAAINGTTGSLNLSSATAPNSIQTAGGANVNSTGAGIGGYEVDGSMVINPSGQWVGSAVLANGNIQTTGVYAVAGGFFGISGNIVIGSCTISVKSGIIFGSTGC